MPSDFGPRLRAGRIGFDATVDTERISNFLSELRPTIKLITRQPCGRIAAETTVPCKSLSSKLLGSIGIDGYKQHSLESDITRDARDEFIVE